MLSAAKQNNSSTASAILPLILVFLCGVSVGALVMSLGLHKAIHSSALPGKAQNSLTLERWKHDLSLTKEQSTQIEQILDDFSKYYDNVVADGNTRILQILNDKQKAKFQQMLKDRR
jgi:Spy/CpxP family protein refolding chaperone